MADTDDKAAESAEKAYAAAAAESKPAVVAPAEDAKAPPAKAEPAPVASKASPPKAAPKPVAAKAAAPKPVAKKAAPAKKPAKAKSVKKTAPKPAAVKKPAPAKAPVAVKAPAKPAKKKSTAGKTTTQSKEPFTMTDATDFTVPMTEAMAEMQDKAKAAYEKSTEMATEMGEFAKGNVEAVVEAGKILSGAMQDMGKSAVEDAKGAFETLTADMKEMAAVKSPTELFQLQSKLMRRNFDALVAYGSKTSESMVKLSGEAMAPISGRMSVAADMVAKAA